jgi:hypothetical protein
VPDCRSAHPALAMLADGGAARCIKPLNLGAAPP